MSEHSSEAGCLMNCGRPRCTRGLCRTCYRKAWQADGPERRRMLAPAKRKRYQCQVPFYGRNRGGQ